MGAAVSDIKQEFGVRVSNLTHVTAAYLTAQYEPLRVHVWTLLDAREENTEVALVKAESRLASAFPDVSFDFSTVHLRGRDPLQFIPEGAIAVKVADSAVERFFRTNSANARA